MKMRRIFCGIVGAINLCSYYLFAQNYVPNYSFEMLTKKPPCKYIFQDSIQNYLTNWFAPTDGTTDLFHSYLNDTCFASPNRTKQYPKSGIAYIGIFGGPTAQALASNQANLPSYLYREYAEVKLSAPLKSGEIYFAEMYTRLHRFSTVMCNNLGMAFTKNKVVKPLSLYTQSLKINPQIIETRLINQKDEWVKISGCFEAKEAYEYLTIGNFFDNQQTQFRIVGGIDIKTLSATNDFAPYYLIDDVSLIHAGIQQLPKSNFLGVDTTLCQGNSVTVHLNYPQASYRWNDGDTLAHRTITQAGTYSIEMRYGLCTFRDTLQVQIELPPRLPPDTILCQGESLEIGVLQSPPQAQYQWNTGQQTSSIQVNQEGQYLVRVQSKSCIWYDTLQVSYRLCPGFIPNVISPNGDGYNEVFYIENLTSSDWHLQIYNRWGTIVFQTENYHNDFDGAGFGAGVYFYCLSNKTLHRSYKGTLTILR